MKIICIKTKAGEELIGRVQPRHGILTEMPTGEFDGPGPWLPQEAGIVSLTQVRIVSLQPISRDQAAVTFIPWSLGNMDGAVVVNCENSADAVYLPAKDIENNYLAQTSGIALGGPGIVKQ